MIKKEVEQALINQIQLEEQSSRIYMSMASWCEVNGYPGAANFLYTHSDEERMHMTKLISYLNDKGGYAVLQPLKMPVNKFKNLLDVFEQILKHEEFVTESINKLYEVAFTQKDYTTSQFLQWYIEEQIEEESTFKGILDKFRLAGNQPGGLFHIDKELDGLAIAPAPKA
ncbi:MAG: ferritin [Bacteroidales bacterium]|nr:ferritin [Bacteroidales bacterium]MCF8402878.1 ferritin [Bacteroidales bacterium]